MLFRSDLAAEQNRFWAFHSIAFANQLGENIGTYSLDRLLEMARLAGLDMDAVTEGLMLDAARARFAALSGEVTAAAVALGITSTPTAVVNGVVLPSADWETLVAAIDAVLAAADGAAPSPSPAG